MNQFVLILAWPVAIAATILFLLRLAAVLMLEFSEKFQAEERIKEFHSGRVRRYPLPLPFIIAAVSWAWIFTNPLG